MTHPARLLLLLLCVLVLLPAQRAAVAQQSVPQQPADGPPSGPPPDGGPGGPPLSSGSNAEGGSSNSGSANQPGSRPGAPSPAMQLDRMIKAMKAASVPMSDTQKVAVLGILEDQETAMESLRSATDRSTAMQQMQSLQQSARTAILAVLTEPQQKIYAAMRQGPPARPGASGTTAGSGTAHYTAPVGETNIDANTGGGIPAL